jgi:cell wall-associated NlpC family hydrolase
MITEVTVWARQLARWKQLAIIGLMLFNLAAMALPAQASTVTQEFHLLLAAPTALRLDWSPSPGATSYTYQLYQMNGDLARSGLVPGSTYSVICRDLHPGWRYRAEVWASPGSPGSSPYATLYMTLPSSNPAREIAFQWAQTQAGLPYRYGGQGIGGYDCSGLVQAAYLHAGIWLPRTTGEMLQYWRLERVSAPQQGDLVFFGAGHVELYAAQDQSFGAEYAGTGWNRWWPGNWWPTAFYRVSGAG